MASLARYLDARPLAPEIDAGRGLDHFGDVRAADARRRLKKVEATVAALYELGVRDAARESERADEFAVERFERLRVLRPARHCAREEDAASVRDLHRRLAVFAHSREDDRAIVDD